MGNKIFKKVLTDFKNNNNKKKKKKKNKKKPWKNPSSSHFGVDPIPNAHQADTLPLGQAPVMKKKN